MADAVENTEPKNFEDSWDQAQLADTGIDTSGDSVFKPVVEPVEPTEPAEPVVEPAEPPAAEPAEPPAAEPAEPAVDPVAERLREVEEALAKIKAKPEEPAEPVVEPEPPIYSDEEQAALGEFSTEWPEVSKGVQLMLRKVQADTITAVMSALNPVLAPITQNYQQTVGEQHYNAIVAAHPDYQEIYDDVVGWIDKQPNYMKNAYTEVAKNGSSADVIDLISRYKQATGVQTPKPAPAKPKPAAAELPDEAKQAASSLGVVTSQRTVVPKVTDPGDFDSAWDEALLNDN